MGFEQSFSTVSSLVKDFQANEKYYLSPEYQEVDVRGDYIDKFFTALGWDVKHNIQKNPYEQEVRVERLVQVAKAQKRADYSFYLAPNFKDVKFFVEAKKPSRNLENADDYFQTVRYGWNASTPIAILTDFEEFIILDCRFRPDIGNILNSKIERFHYSDYLDEDKFRKLYHLFSHEAVADNSIEKYADALPKPKGKTKQKIKGGYQSIDEAFLEELDQIRESLAKSFKKNNEHLSSEELTEAVQRTIDRLVFIRFLEDKLIEPHHYLSEFGNRKTVWEDFLLTSRTLDAKYNGIVFKKHLVDSANIIEPDDKTFSFICEELSHLNSPYDFDKIPIHILGSIYERFLGKIVNATSKRVTIEEKPEVRKAGGVYYTPQYIVNYIVDNTIGKLIEGKAPKQIAKMRFADIACGSGSFLITVFDKLLEYHKKWYQANPVLAKKDGCVLLDDAWRLTLLQKQKILLNNIYGVDIDQQAVEVTQLSLYLKLLEDETTATANDTWVLFKEKLLPNLSKNIICGNSLIGTDILNPTSFLPFAKGEDEGGVDELKLKPMNFENVFPEVMNGGGFDAIVGNPPYLKLTLNNLPQNIFNYYNLKYKSLKGGSSKNLFQLFIEKALSLNPKLFSFIVPEALLTTSSNNVIRSLMLDNNFVTSLTVFDKFVFKDATIGSVVFVLEEKNEKKLNTKIANLKADGTMKVIKEIELGKEDAGWDTSSVNVYSTLIKKISQNKILMKDLVSMSKGMVVKNRNDYLKNTPFKSSLPFLLGSSISRYEYKYDLYGDYDQLIVIGGTRDYLKQTKTPRLLIRRTGDILCAVYSENPELIESTLYILTSEKIDLFCLLGLLNSRLFTFYLKQKLITNVQGFPQILMGQLDQLPIITLDPENHSEKKIISLVTQMIETKKQLQQVKTQSDKDYLQRKCDSIDKQIDQLVYETLRFNRRRDKDCGGCITTQ